MTQVVKGVKEKRGIDRIMNVEHNDIAGAKKVVQSGMVIGDVFGNNSGTAQLIGEKASVRAFNTDAAVQYIKFGDDSVGVPTVTDGIAIAPNGEIYLSSGSFEYVRTSSNNVQVIVSQDRL